MQIDVHTFLPHSEASIVPSNREYAPIHDGIWVSTTCTIFRDSPRTDLLKNVRSEPADILLDKYIIC